MITSYPRAYFKTMSPEERFWHFTNKSGPMPPAYTGLTSRCWQWTGNLCNGGYGMIRAGGKKLIAHRFSYELLKGPLEDMQSLHQCDNPGCVNPAHLFRGTQENNIHDMCRKSRQRTGCGNTVLTAAKGEATAVAKLTEDEVRTIRAMHIPRKISYTRIAAQFGVSPVTVALIVRRKTWKHVTETTSVA